MKKKIITLRKYDINGAWTHDEIDIDPKDSCKYDSPRWKASGMRIENEITEKVKIIHEDNMQTFRRMQDESVDLIVTSPPYDNLRDYESTIPEELFSELYRVLKQGGVLCWNVFDEKIKNSYSGSSMKQALKFIDQGFNLHQYLIYEKNSVAFNAKKTGKLYTNIFEFVFVLSKGEPKTVNLICDKKNKYAGQSSYDGKVQKVAEYSPRTSIWKYVTSKNEKSIHPAVMPEMLAFDIVRTYSQEQDFVFDPYLGSGTTAKVCHKLNRAFVGSEIDEEYFNDTSKRLQTLAQQKTIF